MKKIILILPVCLALGACGFQPVHGNFGLNASENQTLRQTLQHVQIANIPDRNGQFLRNELIDRFYKDGRPTDTRFELKISPIQETVSDLDLTKESDATRSQLKMNTDMRLVDKETGEVVLSRALTAVSSYNILVSEFATRVSEQNTRENALNDIARQIELHLSLYFKR